MGKKAVTFRLWHYCRIRERINYNMREFLSNKPRANKQEFLQKSKRKLFKNY
jgi:hypothetical protein